MLNIVYEMHPPTPVLKVECETMQHPAACPIALKSVNSNKLMRDNAAGFCVPNSACPMLHLAHPAFIPSNHAAGCSSMPDACCHCRQRAPFPGYPHPSHPSPGFSFLPLMGIGGHVLAGCGPGAPAGLGA
jgi:hypothetical protein